MNAKTPAMILMEFSVKNKIPPPEYNLIMCNMGTHVNEFQYQVKIAGITAIGIGRSKQVAKHDAAFKAMKLLRENGLYEEVPIDNFNANLHRNEPENSNIVNYIGNLQDNCSEHKIPQPFFHEISDVGPSHLRNFTYECRMGSLKTQATAATKKQAKQLAAKLMLDKMKGILPHLLSETENFANALNDANQIALEKYGELGYFNVIESQSRKVKDCLCGFNDIMEEKQLTISDFPEISCNDNAEENLSKILAKLGLEYKFTPFPECKNMMLFCIVNNPLCLIECGKPNEVMKEKLINDAFRLVKIFLKAE